MPRGPGDTEVLTSSPLHGLGAGQFPGQRVSDGQHVGAAVGQRALLIQHQPVGHKEQGVTTQEPSAVHPARCTRAS